MEIKHSLTEDGEPRIDWVQTELFWEGYSSGFLALGIGLIPALVATTFTVEYMLSNDPEHTKGIGRILGWIFTFPFLGVGVMCAVAFPLHKSWMGKAESVATLKNGKEEYSGFFSVPVECFMYASRTNGMVELCFVVSKQDRERLTHPDSFYVRRIDGPLAFSLSSEAEWNATRPFSPEIPICKTVHCDFGGGDIIVAAQHYGAQWEINELRLAMQRAFGDAWREKRRLPDTAGLPSSTALAPRPVSTAPRKVRRFEDDDVI